MRNAASRAHALVASVLSTSVLFTSLTTAAPARAGDASAEPTGTRSTIVDEARLRDGSVVRGILLERTAGGDVTMQLPSGEIRHFRKVDLEYAGVIGGKAPAAVELAPPQAATAAGATVGTVRFEATEEDVNVHVRVDEKAPSVGAPPATNHTFLLKGETFREICATPCTATVSLGPTKLALNYRGGLLFPVDDIDLRAGGKYTFAYESHGTSRSAGVWMAASGFGVAIGFLTALIIFSAGSGAGGDAHDGLVAGSGIAAAVGAGLGIAGVFLATQPDSITVHATTPDALVPQGEPTPMKL